MRYIKTYEGFETIREDIEDCCLEIFDLGLNFNIENHQLGKKKATNKKLLDLLS